MQKYSRQDQAEDYDDEGNVDKELEVQIEIGKKWRKKRRLKKQPKNVGKSQDFPEISWHELFFKQFSFSPFAVRWKSFLTQTFNSQKSVSREKVSSNLLRLDSCGGSHMASDTKIHFSRRRFSQICGQSGVCATITYFLLPSIFVIPSRLYKEGIHKLFKRKWKRKPAQKI